MRLYDISRFDIEAVISRPVLKDIDERGNPRLMGVGLNGRAIIVVIADDDPDFVITTFPDD
jgi:hypothetical protein